VRACLIVGQWLLFVVQEHKQDIVDFLGLETKAARNPLTLALGTACDFPLQLQPVSSNNL
jgi:hypothetical protein